MQAFSLRICAAALAGLAMQAQAQSSVQLMGLADLYAGSVKYAGQSRNAVLGSGGLTTSWWGLKGTEDLGSGLKADFNITAFMRMDTGEMGRFGGDPFFSRDANVGLSGGFGTLRIGRSMAPNFLPTILTNPFGDSFTVSPLVLHANMSTAAWGKASLTTPADTGWSNQLTYSTPSLAGLKANLHYQFGEQSGNGQSGKKNVGLNVMYGAGPLSLVAFYERAQINNPVVLNVMPTKTDWMVGGSYDLSVAKLYATYGQAKVKSEDRENKTVSLGLDIPIAGTPGTIKAAAARTKAEVGNVSATRSTYSLGYDHFLSKRTDLYGVAMHDRVTRVSSGTSLIVGIRHRF